MVGQELVKDYFNRIQLLLDSMKAPGEMFSYQQIIEKILRTLTPRFEYIVAIIKDSKELENIEMEEMQNHIYQRIIEINVERVVVQALQVQIF